MKRKYLYETGVGDPALMVVSTDVDIVFATTFPSSVTPYDAASWYMVSNTALSPLSNRTPPSQFAPDHASLPFCGFQRLSAVRAVIAMLAANVNTICFMVLSFSLVIVSRIVTIFKCKFEVDQTTFT